MKSETTEEKNLDNACLLSVCDFTGHTLGAGAHYRWIQKKKQLTEGIKGTIFLFFSTMGNVPPGSRELFLRMS